MGLLPSIVSALSTQANQTASTRTEAPIKRIYRFDFNKKEFITDSMNHVTDTDNPTEVLKQTVDKILHDPRYKYPIYSTAYGNEIQELIENEDNYELFICELKRLYEDALIYHPLIKSISGFKTERIDETIQVTFTVIGANSTILNYSEEVQY